MFGGEIPLTIKLPKSARCEVSEVSGDFSEQGSEDLDLELLGDLGWEILVCFLDKLSHICL